MQILDACKKHNGDELIKKVNNVRVPSNIAEAHDKKNKEKILNNLKSDPKLYKEIQNILFGNTPDGGKVKCAPKVLKPDTNNQDLEKPIVSERCYPVKNPNEVNWELKAPSPKECQKSRRSSGSKHRHKDITTTQFAIADDDNVSAVQQITKGGGPALTLVSKWQYSFDDSEEINPELENNSNLLVPDMYLKNGTVKINGSTKNDSRFVVFQSKERWKTNLKETYKYMEMHTKRRRPVRRSISHPAKIPPNLTVRNIMCDDKKPKLFHIGDVLISEYAPQGLPRCWSCPTISLHIRSHLKPPLKQQASFDENVYEVDVMRNVAAKQKLNEEIVPPSDERRTSLPYLNVSTNGSGTPVKEKPMHISSSDESKLRKKSLEAFMPYVTVSGTQMDEKCVHISSPGESKLHRKSLDTVGKSLLYEINGALDEQKLSTEIVESDSQSFKPLKKSSSQKGILKKNSYDKSISFQNSNENKLQRSLSGPYDKWHKREISCSKPLDNYVSANQMPSEKVTFSKNNENFQNADRHEDYSFVSGTKNPNSSNFNEKKDVMNGNAELSSSSIKNVNETHNKSKTISVNTGPVKCYPSDSSMPSNPNANNTESFIDKKHSKKNVIALDKSCSSKDLKSFINGITDSKPSVNPSNQQSQINRFNHARRSLTSEESVCQSDKRNSVDNSEDHQPSRIPVRFSCSKNCNDENGLSKWNETYPYKYISSEEKFNHRSSVTGERRRPRSLIIWQNNNTGFGEDGNENCLHNNFHVIYNDTSDYNVVPAASEQNNPTSESTNTSSIQQVEEKTVQRRRRANPDCKYVKDESELKLNFVRRRQRPTSITSLSRIPRPCHNKLLPDRNSTFFGSSTDNVHSVCQNSAIIDAENGLNLQRVSSMPSVPLLGEKQLPIYFQGQKVGHSAIHELPPPPSEEPPPNHCLPSRFVAAF